MSDHRIFKQHSNFTRVETVALNREKKAQILKNEKKHKTRIKKTTNTTTGNTSRYNQDVKSFKTFSSGDLARLKTQGTLDQLKSSNE